MNMNLKFTDKTQADSVLLNEEGQNFRNIDTIGTIYERTGGTDEEPVMTALEGWHVNVFVMPEEDKTPLEAFEVFPATPVRVWA